MGVFTTTTHKDMISFESLVVGDLLVGRLWCSSLAWSLKKAKEISIGMQIACGCVQNTKLPIETEKLGAIWRWSNVIIWLLFLVIRGWVGYKLCYRKWTSSIIIILIFKIYITVNWAPCLLYGSILSLAIASKLHNLNWVH